MRATLAALTLLASVPNCTDLYSLATHGLSNPVITTQPSGATAVAAPGGARVTIPLLVQNPNDFPISVESVDYTVTVNGGQGFSGTQEATTVDESSTETVEVSGLVPSATFRGLRGGQTVTFTVTGVAHADSPAGINIDVAFTAGDSFVVPSGLP